MSDSHEPNDQLLLVCGMSGSGKSASLRNLLNQEKWLYLNTEAGKRLPFKNKFMNGGLRIEDFLQVFEAFDYAHENPDVAGVITDSLTFWLDMIETQHVLRSSNSQKAWGDFAQYFKQLMQEKVTRLNKPVVFLAHVKEELDEASMQMKTSVPVKGSLKGNGIEAYFSTVVACKKMKTKDLEKFPNELLILTEEEKELGFKHVFQTRITKETTGERIRSPMGMFTKEQTYINNDVQLLLNHLNKYYGVN
jgi:hypothetical protein